MFTLTQFDSIYIENTSNETLKVFKETTEGKNIYAIDQYWTSKPSRSIHTWTYEITDEDLDRLKKKHHQEL